MKIQSRKLRQSHSLFPVSAGLGGSTPSGFSHQERKDWLEMESDGYVQYATLWDRGVIISPPLRNPRPEYLVRKSYLGLGQPSTRVIF